MASPHSACAAIPSLLGTYAPPSDRFDECLDGAGCLRGPWPTFFDRLGPNPREALKAASDACHRAVIEQEVSMNIYAGSRSSAKPWPIDVLPLLLESSSWKGLSDGLKQRAHLYNELLHDVYGPQKILRERLLPAGLVLNNPGFLRACVDASQSGRPFLQTYAADVARSPDGRWWVLEDRLDAPAGLGYTLQNRIMIRHVLRSVFREMPVIKMYDFFQYYRASLANLSPGHITSNPVFLTPGTANEAYFDDTYLARYLGYPTVEGEDLTTRGGQVYLRTVGGLRAVDTILRRVDSNFCDPLELNAESLLGVPGLLEASRGGKVALANQLGGAVFEGTGILAFLPSLCRSVLGEELRLPSAATWWCGQSGPLDYVLQNLETLVIKPTFGRDSLGTLYGGRMTGAERRELADALRANPSAYCGQERVHLGTAPSWDGNRLAPRSYVMRVFLCWHGGEYHLMPGGLTRFNESGEDGIVSLQRGSISKDTWVLHDGPASQLPLITLPERGGLARSPSSTSSRLADNLYWLGRYLERTTQIGRVIEKLDPLLEEEIVGLDKGVTEDAVRLCLRLQDTFTPVGTEMSVNLRRMREISTDPFQPSSLASNIRELSRILELVKGFLPPEAWQSARQLRSLAASASIISVLRELRSNLGALEMLVAETLPRDTGWRFLDLGRRIERSKQLLFSVQAFLPTWQAATATEFRLQTLLHMTDGLFTYQSCYQGGYEIAPVLSCLFDTLENPRSVAFQIDRILDHLEMLPEDIDRVTVLALRKAARDLALQLHDCDTRKLAEEATLIPAQASRWLDALSSVSDMISGVYFAHLEASE